MPPMTRADRAARVADAVANLPAMLAAARGTERECGPDDPRTLAAWEAVEGFGAVVHRQGRLLAGKTKGG